MAYVKMEVHGITLDADSNSPILILMEAEGEHRSLPIWIGLLEATAIATEMEKIEFARPMTHDLLMNIIQTMGAEVLKVNISDLKDNTYHAEISLRRDGEDFTIDARPSDAVAIALRASADIYVEEAVIEKAAPSRETAAKITSLSEEQKRWADMLEELDPDNVKYKM